MGPLVLAIRKLGTTTNALAHACALDRSMLAVRTHGSVEHIVTPRA